MSLSGQNAGRQFTTDVFMIIHKLQATVGMDLSLEMPTDYFTAAVGRPDSVAMLPMMKPGLSSDTMSFC